MKNLNLFTEKSLAPNTNLVSHLTDCIRDHGPVWLYSFERMNGILRAFQTNNYDVTIQLIRKFSKMQAVALDQWQEKKNKKSSLLYLSHIIKKDLCQKQLS